MHELLMLTLISNRALGMMYDVGRSGDSSLALSCHVGAQTLLAIVGAVRARTAVIGGISRAEVMKLYDGSTLIGHV